MIVWSKFEPGVWAEVHSDPDHHGMCPATVYNSKHEVAHVEGMDEPQPFHTLIHMNEWSEQELAPVPEGVPEMVYIGFSADPLAPNYKVYEGEREAKRALNTGKAWGYVPVMISRTMIPPVS